MGKKAKTDAAEKKAAEIRVEDKYEKGEAIGVVAAQSIAEPATQTALRSYHAGGRTKLLTTQGLPRLLELFDARKVPTTPAMTIHLTKEYNTREKAKKLASAIKESTLKQVLAEDSLDLLNLRVELRLEKNQIKDLGLNANEIVKLIKKSLKNIEVKASGNTITIETQKAGTSIKDLQTIRIKARNIHIKGIKGITHAVVEKEKDGWVIRTLGSNLKKVLGIEGVDATRTRCNNIYEVAKVLGIEAARNAIVKEVSETLREQGVNTDIRHLLLVADAMTNNGEISAIGRYGLAGGKASILAKANFEETVKHLTEAAIEGGRDPLNSVIENIIVGKVAPIGTGLVKVGIKMKGEKS